MATSGIAGGGHLYELAFKLSLQHSKHRESGVDFLADAVIASYSVIKANPPLL